MQQIFAKLLYTIRAVRSRSFLWMIHTCAFILVTSCTSEPTEQKPQQSEKTDKVEKVVAHLGETPVDTLPTKVTDDSVSYIELQFSDVSIFVEEMEMGWKDKYMDETSTIYKVQSDTAFLNVYIGDWFYDKQFYVRPNEFDQVRLYEKSVDHIAVSSNQVMEVPFCVLTRFREWKSEWREVSLEGGNKFNSEDETAEVEIDFSIEEIRAAVKESCGERWVEEFTEYATLKEMGYEIFTSQIIFKMVLTNSETGKELVRFIVFDTPTSC